MKGTEVTPEQLQHADLFLQNAQVRETVAHHADGSVSFVVSRHDLIRLLAWYGAIRAKSGHFDPLPIVRIETYCNCANPGVDLTTGLCDCVSPGTLKCACHYPNYEERPPNPESRGKCQ
jgi:hypothetical protein